MAGKAQPFFVVARRRWGGLSLQHEIKDLAEQVAKCGWSWAPHSVHYMDVSEKIAPFLCLRCHPQPKLIDDRETKIGPKRKAA